MKIHPASMLKIAVSMLLLSLLSFIPSHSANATCGFTISTTDSVWTFSAAAGSSQSRYLVITNTTDSTIDIQATISGTSRITVSSADIKIKAKDTAGIMIIFQAPSGASAGTVAGNLRLGMNGTDCRTYLALSCTVTGGSTGHDKVVSMSPTSISLTTKIGADTCQAVYLVNYTGAKVTVSSIAFSIAHPQFTISPAFNGSITIDSGGYYRFTVCYAPDAKTTSSLSDTLLVSVDYGGATHTLTASIYGYPNTTVSNEDALVADPSSFSFGNVAYDSTSCRNIIVRNTGTHSIALSGWYLCGNKDYSLTPAPTKDTTFIPVGGSMTFTVCYTPIKTTDTITTSSCYLNLIYNTADPIMSKSLAVNFYGIKQGSAGGNSACLRTEQGGNNNDAIVVGGSAEHNLYLINTSSDPITVNSFVLYGPDANSFSVPSSQFPITVPANSTNTSMVYEFTPTLSTKLSFYGKVSLSLLGKNLSCDSAEGYLVGYLVHGSSTVDTVVRPLFPTESRTLGLEGSGAVISNTFYFTNNLTVDCTVNKIYLANGAYFTIRSTNPTPTPFVLHPGANVQVVIGYMPPDKNVHHDSLIIDADHQLQSTSFGVQALQVAAASVTSLPAGVGINVSPNPATDHVVVSAAGVNSIDAKIYDLLGNAVASSHSTANLKLSTLSFAPGSYIVRISGTSATGEEFVTSKRIIVSK